MKIDEITNKKSFTKEHNPNDEFYTPNYAIRPLEKYIKPNSKILCPFDTEESNFVKIFSDNKHSVAYSHIENHVDFFDLTNLDNFDYIISNPPYSKKFEVFEKLFATKTKFAMLVGVVGLFESQKRFNLFKENDFEVMYLNKRIAYFRDYAEPKPSLNPPFSSVYICRGILPKQIVFEEIYKNK